MQNRPSHIIISRIRLVCLLFVAYSLLLQPVVATFCIINNDHIEIVDFDSDKDCDEENNLEEDNSNEKIEQQFRYASQDQFYTYLAVAYTVKQSHTISYDIEIPFPPPELI